MLVSVYLYMFLDADFSELCSSPYLCTFCPQDTTIYWMTM